MSDIDELFWGGYLKFLIEQGAVTPDTPRAEVERIKADFMSGLRGDPVPCDTNPFRPDHVQRVAERINQKESQ